MNKTVFTGSGVAIITPFNENGIDFDTLGQLIDFHVENGTDAIVICGTTGEAATMPDEEHLSAIEYTVKRVNKRMFRVFKNVIGGHYETYNTNK